MDNVPTMGVKFHFLNEMKPPVKENLRSQVSEFLDLYLSVSLL